MNKELKIFNIVYCQQQPKGTMVYFHGGGFMASTENDLPSYQFDALSTRFDMVLVDYPLAPENSLLSILDQTTQAIASLFQSNDYNKLHLDHVVFYGRSAGAYMAMYVCAQLIQQKRQTPDQLVLLYGYPYFNDDKFRQPSSYYQAKVALSKSEETQILAQKRNNTSRFLRTLVYMQARKEGKWFDYLSIDESNFSKLDLRAYVGKFPPTYLACSANDPDVDPTHTYWMSEQIEPSITYISNNHEHAFDQQLSIEDKKFFEQLLLFLDSPKTHY